MNNTETESQVQFIELNRSKHLEDKKGFYDGKPVNTRYLVVGDELKAYIAEETKKEVGAKHIDTSNTEGNNIISINY